MVSHYTTKTPPNPQLNRLSGGFGLFIYYPAKGGSFHRLSSSVLTTSQTATPNSRRQNVAVCSHPLFTAPLRVVENPDGKILPSALCPCFLGPSGLFESRRQRGVVASRSKRHPKIPDGKNNGQTAIQTAKFCRLRSALIFCGFETLYRYRFCKISASDRVYYIYPCRGIYNNPGRGGRW